MSKLKVLLVDDHVLTRAGIKMLIDKVSDIEIVGEADDGPSAVAKTLHLQPSVVLMDIRMPIFDGIEATRQIKQAFPQIKILMLSAQDLEVEMLAALAAGADGYCLKNISAESLCPAIRAISEGALWIDPAIAKLVLKMLAVPPTSSNNPVPSSNTVEPKQKFGLTPREFDVLKLLVEGRSNREIADSLVLSQDTIKTHVKHIMDKLAVSDRTQAAVKALRQELV